MKYQFENLTEITDKKTFENVRLYLNELIQYATENGYLKYPDADNEYTREIGRIGVMIADYESLYMKFENIKVKNPLIVTIEKEMRKKELNQRQTAELLEVKENTFSQILAGKRNISMKMAKRIRKVLNINADLILEFA